MKRERRIKCLKCNGTGTVRVDLSALCTTGESWGTSNAVIGRVCPECDGTGMVIEIVETTITYRKSEE